MIVKDSEYDDLVCVKPTEGHNVDLLNRNLTLTRMVREDTVRCIYVLHGMAGPCDVVDVSKSIVALQSAFLRELFDCLEFVQEKDAAYGYIWHVPKEIPLDVFRFIIRRIAKTPKLAYEHEPLFQLRLCEYPMTTDVNDLIPLMAEIFHWLEKWDLPVLQLRLRQFMYKNVFVLKLKMSTIAKVELAVHPVRDPLFFRSMYGLLACRRVGVTFSDIGRGDDESTWPTDSPIWIAEKEWIFDQLMPPQRSKNPLDDTTLRYATFPWTPKELENNTLYLTDK